MNVPDELTCVVLVLTKNGFESILKQIAASSVFTVIPSGIAAIKRTLQSAQGFIGRAYDKVVMVIHQAPSNATITSAGKGMC